MLACACQFWTESEEVRPEFPTCKSKKSKLETSIGDIPVNELNQNESGAQFASLAFAVGGDLGTATESEQAAINCGGCNTCSSCGQGGCSGCGSCSAEEEEEEGAIDP
jgi:hypothetical protein